MTIPLSTHGYIWPRNVPVYIAEPHPEAETETLQPEIMTRSTSAPILKIEEPVADLKPVIKPRRRRRNGNGNGGH